MIGEELVLLVFPLDPDQHDAPCTLPTPGLVAHLVDPDPFHGPFPIGVRLQIQRHLFETPPSPPAAPLRPVQEDRVEPRSVLRPRQHRQQPR